MIRVTSGLPLLLLVACSSGGGSGDNITGGSGSAGVDSATGGGASANLASACAALPRDAVQQVIGMPVTQVEAQDQPSSDGMSSTACVYDLGDARLVQLQVQQFPDNVPVSSVQGQSRTMYQGKMEGQRGPEMPIEEVPGLGRDAFYSPSQHALVVQIDGNRQVTLTVNRLPDLPDTKGKLVTLARHVLG